MSRYEKSADYYRQMDTVQLLEAASTFKLEIVDVLAERLKEYDDYVATLESVIDDVEAAIDRADIVRRPA